VGCPQGARTRASRGNRIARTDISQDLPVIVEIVDTKEKITAFLSRPEEMVKGGLVTVEEIRVVRYGPGQNKLD
jgi:uncharacterized protein